MTTSKRLRTPLVLAGAIMTVVSLAGPASADDGSNYSPGGGTTTVAGVSASTNATTQVAGVSASTNATTQVAGVSASTNATTQVAGVSASAATSAATTGLAFTGTNAIGIGALGGLLLVGGVTMVLVGKRRKVNA
jgi:hypothetical protein